MENNEQVFFDIQSCQFETFSDLTTILHTGDRLYFNAIIGPRDGSTKWRSLKTWIKMRSQQSNSNSSGIICTLDNMSSHSDAEKSDDSSSSSRGSYSRRSNRNNQQLMKNSGHLYQGNQNCFIPGAAHTGSGGQNTPIQSNFTSSSPVGNSSSHVNL